MRAFNLQFMHYMLLIYGRFTFTWFPVITVSYSQFLKINVATSQQSFCLFSLLSCLTSVVFMGLDDLWNDGGVVQRGDVPQVARVLHGNLPQDSPHDFSRACFRKSLHNLKKRESRCFHRQLTKQISKPSVQQICTDSDFKTENLFCDQS